MRRSSCCSPTAFPSTPSDSIAPCINRGPTVLGGNVLAKYAHATGGDIYYAPTREELESLYSRVSEQARNQYTLAFNGGRADRSKIYHTIEVRVKRPGLTLLARDGYYLTSTP